MNTAPINATALLKSLQAWYSKHRGVRTSWGRVTQENMAHEIGVAYCTMSLWLRGEQEPEAIRDDSLEKIRAFLVQMEQVFRRDAANKFGGKK